MLASLKGKSLNAQIDLILEIAVVNEKKNHRANQGENKASDQA
jgi:hypothetical protein